VFIEFVVELLEDVLVLMVLQGALDGLGLLLQSFLPTLLKVTTSIFLCVYSIKLICFIVVLGLIELYLTLEVRYKTLNDFSEQMTVHVDVLDGLK